MGVHDRVRGQDDTLEVGQVTDPLEPIGAVKHTHRHQIVSEALDLRPPLTDDRLGDYDQSLGEGVTAHHRHELSSLADTHLVTKEATADTFILFAFQEPLDASRLEGRKEGERHFG